MKAFKFLFSAAVVLTVLALAAGVVQVFKPRPDGTVRFAPHFSPAAAHWYRSQAMAAAESEQARAVADSVRQVILGR